MNGFHCIWTKPYLIGKKTNEYWMQDYEVLTMIISALLWKKENGQIMFLGDKEALKYISDNKLEKLWDLGIEEIKVDTDISPKVFWAAGKIFALKKFDMPGVMVDLDLIVWKKLDNYLKQDTQISVIHKEDLYEDVYPDIEFFNMKDNYFFCDNIDLKALPCNTAMLYIKNNDFKNYYVDESIKFMKNSLEKNENLCNMVFAEQRMLSICAASKKIEIEAFFPKAYDIVNQDIFTHIWGYKNILKYNYSEREIFCKKIANRIKRDFPEEIATLKNIKVIEKYF